jgi:hypothetical protein
MTVKLQSENDSRTKFKSELELSPPFMTRLQTQLLVYFSLTPTAFPGATRHAWRPIAAALCPNILIASGVSALITLTSEGA